MIPESANLAAFGSEILEAAKKRVADCGGGEYDDEIMEVAHRHGLVQRVVYDPDKHGKVNEDCELGDEIWWWGGMIRRTRKLHETRETFGRRSLHEAELRRACPCQHTTPCHPRCTCVMGASSRGCARCCTYGSTDQQRRAAERLATLIDKPQHLHRERLKWTLEAERLQCEANRLGLSPHERLTREGMLGNAEGILRLLAEISE